MEQRSETLDQLLPALLKAQLNFPALIKDTKVEVGTKFKYKYAQLSDIVKELRPVLAEQGLLISFSCSPCEFGVTVSTYLFHAESGQYISSSIHAPCPVVIHKDIKTGQVYEEILNDPQSIGKDITYFSRYTLSVLGFATEKDDDAQNTGNNPYAAEAKPKAATTTKETFFEKDTKIPESPYVTAVKLFKEAGYMDNILDVLITIHGEGKSAIEVLNDPELKKPILEFYTEKKDLYKYINDQIALLSTPHRETLFNGMDAVGIQFTPDLPNLWQFTKEFNEIWRA